MTMKNNEARPTTIAYLMTVWLKGHERRLLLCVAPVGWQSLYWHHDSLLIEVEGRCVPAYNTRQLRLDPPPFGMVVALNGRLSVWRSVVASKTFPHRHR